MNHKPKDTAICRTQILVTNLTALFFLFSFSLANAQTTIDTRFLDNNANADGSIALTGGVSQSYRSTAESIITYEVLRQPDATAAVNGRAYLDSIAVNSTENLALRLLTSPLNAPRFNATLAEINQRQNRDGGIGAFVDFGSDLISTSFVLRALSRARVVNEISGRAVSYLLAQQSTDGSWSLQDNPNRVETTALVVNALWLYRQSYQLSDALSNGVAYLASQRGTDNLWEETEGSALALSAILNVEVDRSAYQTSLINFANLQNSNGSFGDDVYLTALGLRVLDAIQRPAPDEIVVSGQAVDGDTGLPLANVQVELTGPETLNQVTDSNGMFNWQGLQPGNYRLSLSLNGFSTLTTNTLLQTGDKRDFGTLILLKAVALPTTGTIIGTVMDAADGKALAGVMVTATGASKTAMTNADGQFQLNGISPGAVSVQAALPSYATAIANANILAGQTLIFSPNLTSLIEAQVVVEGVVMDRDTNQVLEGVVVRVQGGGNGTEATTDASGRYEIPGLQAGNLTVSASLAGYQTVSGNVAAPTNARINFSPSLVLEGVPPEPVANSGIIGRVIDRISGLPLSGADISLILNSNTQSLVSGADGEFSLSGLSAGTAQLNFSFTGYETINASIELPENIILNIGGVTLLADGVQETAAVRGIVVDSRTNEPLAGVVINGQFASGNVSLVTDASGVFEFLDLLETEGELVFALDTYNTTNFGLQLTLNETLDIGQIRLRPEEIEALIPDLAVQSLSAAAINANLQTLAIDGSVSVSVRNQGNAEVNLPTNVLAFHDVDGSNTFEAGIDQALGQVTLSDTIGVDEDVSISIPVSGSLPFRDAPIYVWVDSDQALIEADEDNNITSTADQCESQQIRCNLLEDNFNDGNAVGWNEIPNQIDNTNAWNVSSGVYDNGSSAQGGAAFTGNIDWTDYVAETRLQFPDGATNDAGLLFRYQDVNNWYQFRIKDGEARIISRINGVVDTGIQSTTITVEANRWYTLRIRLQGSRVKAYLDNELIFNFDGLQLDSGAVGYLDDGVYVQYDDLCVSTTSDPIVKWRWQGSSVEPSADSVYGPVTVGQLTDDNNDGLIDINDTPDVIFGSFGGTVGVLNAVNGADGSEIWSTRDFDITRFGSTAIGDIDGDSIVEIIVVNDNRSELFAFEHDGSLKWRVSSGPTRSSPRDAIAIADLDGDGSPEIIHGRRVHNADGTLRWEGSGGFGDNSNYGYLPTVADIDLDGTPEVIAGRTVYSASGDIVWNRTDIGGDGFTGIGNFDEDDFAEIVVVTSGRVYVLEHTGETLWGPVNIPGGGLGGPPTISDLDGDGEPEIGVAGSRNYVALETDGSIRWTSLTQDLSSNRTGSSVFDFDGDGRVEVLYGDELFFRIYDGISGEVLFEIENTSGTTLEYPIVADIDGDNSAEIVVTSSGGQTTGVRAFEANDGSWANTRRIWNQHTYHINNVNEDGTIPLQEEPSWLSHNTYRLNTFPGRNVLALPDLTVSQLKVVDPSGGQPLSLSARIGNGGGTRSLSGIALRFYNGNPSAGGVLLAEQALPIIEPGQFTDITIDNISGISAGDTIFVVVDPDNEMEECREDNNQMSIVALGFLGDISLNLGATIFGSNTDIDLATQITNTGSLEGNYTIALSILDASRIEVASVAAFDVTVLPPAESISFSNLWNTGTATSGNYIVQATLLDVDGNVLDTAEATFTISDLTNPDGTPNGNPAATLRATTDRPFYHVDDQVQLDALVENITAIHPISSPELLVVVTDASGTELFNETVALSSLAPGQIAGAMRALNLVQAAEGIYQYQVTLLGNGGTSFSTATASFEVLNDLNAAMRGSVAVQASEVSQGDSQVCTFATLNTGTQDLSALAVNYLVLNVDAQTTITNNNASLDVAAGGSTNQLQSFSTSDFAPGNYACLLEATLDGESRTLAYGQFTVIEIPILIESSISLANRGRILVMVDPIDNSNNGEPISGEDNTATAQRDYLNALLTNNQWRYTLVDNADDFADEFHSGLYSAAALLSEEVFPYPEVEQLLVEAHRNGMGLLVSGDSQRQNHRIEQSLGIHLNGDNSQANSIIDSGIIDQPVADNVSVSQGVILTHCDAEVWAVFNAGGNREYNCAGSTAVPAVTSANYGQGQHTYFAYDILDAATSYQSLHQQLFLHALQTIQPSKWPIAPGRVVPVVLGLQNLGGKVAVDARFTLPQGGQIIDSQYPLSFSDGVWLWQQDLESPTSSPLLSDAENILYVQLPEQTPTDILLHADINAGINRETMLDYTELSINLGSFTQQNTNVISIQDDILYIRGTDGKDSIQLSDDGHQWKVQADFNDGEFKQEIWINKSDVTSVDIKACGGEDQVQLGSLTIPSVVYGDGDDDQLQGSDANDVFFGGSGDDQLQGNKGDDALFGGFGDDDLQGGDGKDIKDSGSGNSQYDSCSYMTGFFGVESE